VLFCLSVSVKWLTVKTASEVTYIVSSGALNSTQTNSLLSVVVCGLPCHHTSDRTLIVRTTDYCWRSSTCRIAAPYKFHVDWLIDWLTWTTLISSSHWNDKRSGCNRSRRTVTDCFREPYKLTCLQGGSKSKLLILGECVNKTEKTGWTAKKMKHCLILSPEIFYVTTVLCWNILWLKTVSEIIARQTRASYAKFYYKSL